MSTSTKAESILTAEVSPWLKPYHFKPGESGNPGGRRKKPLTEALENELTPDVCKRIAQKMVAKAEAASVMHFESIADRVEGKVGNDDGDSNGGNITISVVFDVPLAGSRPTAVLGAAIPQLTKAEDAS